MTDSVSTKTVEGDKVKEQTSSMLSKLSPDKIPLPPRLASISYAARKSVAEGFLDFALLLANTCQLRSVLDVPYELRTWTFWPLVIMISLSLLLQLTTGVILFLMASTEAEEGEKNEKKLKTLNNVSVGLIAVVTFFNVFIAGFGISFTETLVP